VDPLQDNDPSYLRPDPLHAGDRGLCWFLRAVTYGYAFPDHGCNSLQGIAMIVAAPCTELSLSLSVVGFDGQLHDNSHYVNHYCIVPGRTCYNASTTVGGWVGCDYHLILGNGAIRTAGVAGS
jgi:hypothetical protein